MRCIVIETSKKVGKEQLPMTTCEFLKDRNLNQVKGDGEEYQLEHATVTLPCSHNGRIEMTYIGTTKSYVYSAFHDLKTFRIFEVCVWRRTLYACDERLKFADAPSKT
ncbi:hypothetical protein LOAG_11306 [Loa loa]|uniref:Uncharacterized protein n=1 Tax=Loa loa TaxID=7209 RepID=A0A1S0TPQ1_LOALO|nr:hypothetical protein LOAG_11306 [Loa loa]EFO17195.1 hypothetical protein LOAG_11306 [Loa loa]